MKTTVQILVFALALLLVVPAFATKAVWVGLGGDVYNTNRSPYPLSTSSSYIVKWSVPSADGYVERTSGMALADSGRDAAPYVFGSTGYGGNRAYRVSRIDGSATNWLAQSGVNDSGQGYFIGISPNGQYIVHQDVGQNIRGFSTGTNPAGVSLWFKNMTDSLGYPKFGPDNNFYGRGRAFAPADTNMYLYALDPTTGSLIWSAEDFVQNPRPGAFYDNGSTVVYVVSGTNTKIVALDTQTNPGTVLWSYDDSSGGYGSPTVDPDTGNIYVFRGTRPIALNWSGQLMWEGDPVGNTPVQEFCNEAGALSADGSVYYVQTGTGYTGWSTLPWYGSLYAYDTISGSIIWSYNNEARWGAPVVSSNGVIIVNNANCFYPTWFGTEYPTPHHTFYAIKDEGASPTVLWSYEMRVHPDEVGNWPALGPGTIYFDGVNQAEEKRIFCLTGPDLPLMIETISVSNGRINELYSFVMKAIGGTESYTWSQSGMPFDFDINTTTGEITGTPTTSGSYTFTVTVTDSGLATDSRQFTVVIDSIDFGKTNLKKGYVSYAYSDGPGVVGGYPPYTWSVASGAIPPGLSLNTSTGDITGNPTTSGTYNFELKVEDSDTPANVVQGPFVIVVDDVFDIITLSVHNGKPNVAYTPTTFKYIASDAGPFTWSSQGTIPPGLSLSNVASDYVLSGTPTTPGTYQFSIAITNNTTLASVEYAYALIVADLSPWQILASDPSTFPFGDVVGGPSSITFDQGVKSANFAHKSGDVTGAAGNGKLYACGGRADGQDLSQSGRGYPAIPQARFSIYDIATDAWDSAYWKDWTVRTQEPSNPYPVHGSPTGFNHRGGTAKPISGQGVYTGTGNSWAYDYDNDGTQEFYVFGGTTVLDGCSIYDPDTNSWSASSSIAGNTVYLASSAQKDSIVYVIGGAGAGNQILYAYDCDTDTWSVVNSNAYFNVYQPGMGIIGDKIYVAGGADYGQTVTHNKKLSIYDITTDTWSDGADMPQNVMRTATVVYGGNLYLVGGDGGVDKIQKYDPVSDAWTVLPIVLPQGRGRHEAKIVNGTLYVFDGKKSDGTFSNDLWAIPMNVLDPSPAEKPVITDVERTASVKITWQSAVGATYRVESAPGPYNYNEALMTWTNEVTGLASGGTSTNWTDTAVTSEKYYRVYTEDAGGDLVADDTVGQMKINIKVGRNMVSSMFEPYPVGGGTPGLSTLDKIVGNQLTGHSFNKNNSDTIEVWQNATAQYKRAWFDSSPLPGTWLDWDTGAAAGFGMDADKGYWFNIITGHVAKDVIFCGRVSKTGRSIPIAVGRNLVGSCFPVGRSLANSGLAASGFTGHSFNKNNSDTVEFWNNTTASYQRYWFDSSPLPGTWQPWDVGQPMRDIAAGDSIWVNVITGHSAFTWNYPNP